MEKRAHRHVAARHELQPNGSSGAAGASNTLAGAALAWYHEIVSLIPQETRKVVRKTIRKAARRYGPEIATAITTGVVTSLLTLGTTPQKKKKKKKRK